MTPYDLQDSPLLLIINAALMTVTAVAWVLSLGILVMTFRRRDHALSEDDSPIARLTYRRAIRNEGAFFMCQTVLLVLSVWSIQAVLPSAPPKAISYYFVTQVGRTFISFILVASTTFDLLDRGEIKRELDRSIRELEQARHG